MAWAWAQRRRRLVEVRFYAKVVSPFFRDRNRSDASDREWETLSRQCGKGELAFLARRCVSPVSLIYLEDDAIAIQRSDLEENLTPLDGRAKGLTEIASHDDSVEGCDEPRSFELCVEEVDLRGRPVDLSTQDDDLAAVVPGKGSVMFLFEPRPLPGPISALQQ